MSHDSLCLAEHTGEHPFDLSPVLEVVGDWAVTTYGLEWIGDRAGYSIRATRLWEQDWVAHLSEKNWTSAYEVAAALERARAWHGPRVRGRALRTDLFSWGDADASGRIAVRVSSGLVEKTAELSDSAFRQMVLSNIGALSRPLHNDRSSRPNGIRSAAEARVRRRPVGSTRRAWPRASGPDGRTVPSMLLPAELTPRHVQDLPLDNQGRPVPAEVPWAYGRPLLSKIDPCRMLILFKEHHCAVCGWWMQPGTPRYRGVGYDEALDFRRLGRQVRMDSAGHLACMLWAACVCPYFAAPSQRRGRKAAVIGAEQLTVQIASLDDGSVSPADARIVYRGVESVRWFSDPASLMGQLEMAIAADPNPRDTRLYWHDDVEAAKSCKTVLDGIVRYPAELVALTDNQADRLRQERKSARITVLPGRRSRRSPNDA